MDLLRALSTFVRVVETGSFSAVARETGTSHSAATRLIGQLEDHFGVRLFHRTTRRLSLTEDGQDLLNHARHLIETTQEMEATLGRQRASPTGLVRVGISPAVATLLVPQLPKVFERYPGLSVELVVGDRFGDLIEERLDLALQRGQPADSSLVARAIGTFGRVLVAAPAYLERRGAPGTPAELAEHSCVIHEDRVGSARWSFNGPDGPVEVTVSGPFRSDNSEVVHRAALAGFGVANAPGIAGRGRHPRRSPVSAAARLPIRPGAGFRRLSVAPPPGAAHPRDDRLPGGDGARIGNLARRRAHVGRERHDLAGLATCAVSAKVLCRRWGYPSGSRRPI